MFSFCSIMGSWWRRLCCYATDYYRFVSWVCVRIKGVCVRFKVLVYEDDDVHRIPYDWVPSLMIEDVYKHAMKPHLYPPHTRIHHLMTFMRYYEGKYTYVWNRLYA